MLKYFKIYDQKTTYSQNEGYEVFSGCFAFNVCNTSVWYGAAILFSNMISGPIWKVLDIDSIDSGFNDGADISTEAKILHKLTLNKI